MDAIVLVIIVLLIIVLALEIKYIVAIHKASREIWHGSDDPLSMSQMLLASLQANAQVLFGIFAIFVIFILMKEKVVSSESGLPLFSALAAYLLGKGFKESSFFDRKKEEKKEKEAERQN